MVNSDAISWCRIVMASKNEFSNILDIHFIGGEHIEVKFGSVEKCKEMFVFIMSAIHGEEVEPDGSLWRKNS